MDAFTDALIEAFRSEYEGAKRVDKTSKQEMIIPIEFTFEALTNDGAKKFITKCTTYTNARFILRLKNPESEYIVLTDGPGGELKVGRGWVTLQCF